VPRQGQVIATGGGAVLDPATRAAARARGFVVWLQVTPVERQLERLAATAAGRCSPRRTAASAAPGLQRDPLYAEVADLRFESDRPRRRRRERNAWRKCWRALAAQERRHERSRASAASRCGARALPDPHRRGLLDDAALAAPLAAAATCWWSATATSPRCTCAGRGRAGRPAATLPAPPSCCRPANRRRPWPASAN
jgi:hypothetical protein